MSLRALALAIAGVLATTAGAFAHAHLKSATPPVNGTVAKAPSELQLAFSEGVDLTFTGVTVTGPDGKPVATGALRLGSEDGAALVVPLQTSLATGTYQVNWHALARDGHKTKGTYKFTIRP